MIPVIILAICYWACSGAVTSVKAARAGDAAEEAEDSAPTAATSTDTPLTLNAADVTFGQWQRALYGRWRTRVRSAFPGQHLGKRASDLFGDIGAAAIAGTALFGFGFASGLGWAGMRFVQQRAPRRPRPVTEPPAEPAGPPAPRPQSKARWRRPGNPFTARPADSGPRFGFRRRVICIPNGPDPRADGRVIEAELLGAPTTPPTGRFAGSEYAEVVPARPNAPSAPTAVLPQITASPVTPNGRAMPEILTIHHLFAWARNVVAHTVNAAEVALLRSRSAAERAERSLGRRNSAVARAEFAAVAAAAARGYAVQLEQTSVRFQSLRMDTASITSIGVAITAAVDLGKLTQRRAEAEAVVAAKAASLAVAEEAAALAAAAEAAGAQACANAVQHMHDTVHARQMPHAIAQAATGNAAAHPDVLAAG